MDFNLPFVGGQSNRSVKITKILARIAEKYAALPIDAKTRAGEIDRIERYRAIGGTLQFLQDVDRRPELIAGEARERLFLNAETHVRTHLSQLTINTGGAIEDAEDGKAVGTVVGAPHDMELRKARAAAGAAFESYARASIITIGDVTFEKPGVLEKIFRSLREIDGVAAGRRFMTEIDKELLALDRSGRDAAIPKPNLRVHTPESGAPMRPYQKLAQKISRSMVGNARAVLQVAASVTDHLDTKITDPDFIKPLSILLPGPTGTGKTMLAGLTAKALNVELLKFNMAEYSEQHSLAKFVGPPPGYSGCDTGGRLVNEIRAARKHPRKPMVILLDEVEKAHHDVWQGMLGFFDAGELDDTRGRVKIPDKTVVFMTTNMLAQEFTRHAAALNAEKMTAEELLSKDTFFSPEFRGRISDIVPLLPLTDEEYIKLVGHTISTTGKQRSVEITFNEEDLRLYSREVRGAYDARGTRGIQRETAKIVRALILEMPNVAPNLRFSVTPDGYSLVPIALSGDAADNSSSGRPETHLSGIRGKDIDQIDVELLKRIESQDIEFMRKNGRHENPYSLNNASKFEQSV